MAAFRQGLNEAGYVEGENVAIEYRWAENQHDRLPALAADLVRRQVAVIVATGGTDRRSRPRRRPRTIPIVFAAGGDPVKSGLVASLSRPGGNVTGVNFFSASLAAKRLELLRELVPGATRVAVLVNPTNSDCRDHVEGRAGGGARHRAANRSPRRQHQPRDRRGVREHWRSERADALFVGADPFFTSRRVQLVTLAARHAMPAIYPRARVRRGRRADELRRQTSRTPIARPASMPAVSSRARSPPTCRCSSRPSSSSSSTSRPPRRSASKFRRRCSPAPTR